MLQWNTYKFVCGATVSCVSIVVQVWLHCLPSNLAGWEVLNANFPQNSLTFVASFVEGEIEMYQQWCCCYGVVMLKPPELHFLSHPTLLSLSWEWTQEVEFSMATTEEWRCLLPLFLVLFHRSPPVAFLWWPFFTAAYNGVQFNGKKSVGLQSSLT